MCGRSEGQALVATTDVDWRDEPVEIARCGDCRAVVISAVLPITMYSEGDWDWYVEMIAGVDTIARMLSKVGAPSGARMLDVGCGFGFGLDVGREMFGWEGIGLDPSVAAVRGRAALGLDIRPGTLDDEFEPEDRFDVIFASEVLEHVPEPRAFLESVRGRLTDHGVFLMTTPDGGAVAPETPMSLLYPTLSVGGHEFLLTEDGLATLLRDAGFVAHVWTEGVTLGALAARSDDALRGTLPSADVDARELVSYCERRAEQAEPGSALALGMARRAVEYAVKASEFARAEAAYPALRTAVHDRCGVDLDEPETTLPVAERHPVLIVVHYYVGVLRLFHDQDPHAAVGQFTAAAAVGAAQFRAHGEYRDSETPTLEFLALAHRAIALAQIDRDAVPGAIADLDAALARGAGSPQLRGEYGARIDAEVRARRTASGTLRRDARAAAVRGYHRLLRSRVPGVAATARRVRSAASRSPKAPD